MVQVRLQKFIADCGVCSRRKAEELMLEGRVRVNGKVVTTLGTKVDPEQDSVKVGRKVIHQQKKGVLLFHKPRGVVSTMDDPEGRPCIADFLPPQFKGYVPVGRLDMDSSGLMILTNDGKLANRLMHPRYEEERVYHARLSGRPSEASLKKLARGIRLEDGRAKAKVKILRENKKSTWVEVIVLEGRNHLVKRMFAAIGAPVERLQRVAHGEYVLGKLAPGEMAQQ